MNDSTRFVKPKEGDLKPCPFCGGEEMVFESYETQVGIRWRVVCCHCMAGIDTGVDTSRRQVALRWNWRKEKLKKQELEEKQEK